MATGHDQRNPSSQYLAILNDIHMDQGITFDSIGRQLIARLLHANQDLSRNRLGTGGQRIEVESSVRIRMRANLQQGVLVPCCICVGDPGSGDPSDLNCSGTCCGD